MALAALFFVAPRLLPPARSPVRAAAARRLDRARGAAVVSLLPAVRRLVVPALPAADVAGDDAADGGGARGDRAALAASASIRSRSPAAVAFLAWHGVQVAADRSAFDLGRSERRYVDVARFVAGHTDPDAVILSVQHSGSLRHLRRSPDAALRRARSAVARPDRRATCSRSAGGRTTCWTAGKWTRSGGASARRTAPGALDWPPMATLGGTIAVYDPIDRRPDASPLAIASTRGTHALCDAPQSWPPVLRMK